MQNLLKIQDSTRVSTLTIIFNKKKGNESKHSKQTEKIECVSKRFPLRLISLAKN